MHMEKAELEKKLKEKEEVSQNQVHLIQNLQKMIVISGDEVGGNAKEVSRKRRRETWCPGKAARGLNKGKRTCLIVTMFIFTIFRIVELAKNNVSCDARKPGTAQIGLCSHRRWLEA